MALNYYI